MERELSVPLEFFPQPPVASVDSRNSLANIKRFLERWMADPGFRARVKENPEEAARAVNIPVDASLIEPLWKNGSVLSLVAEMNRPEGSTLPDCVSGYVRYVQAKLALREKIREGCMPHEPRFRAWRIRQVARTDSQFGPEINRQIIHSPFTFELCNGCSVGCWFCGISAPELGDIFRYTEDHAKLWRGVLQVMLDLCGPAAKNGFCYWATDPLDNPDYEKFMIDFHEIIGSFPQTTTAQPTKNPTRTRALLKLAREKGCAINRFSLITMGMWDKVQREFSAEELLYTECLPLNKESDLVKANAGRFRDKAVKDPAWYERERIKIQGKVKVTSEGMFGEKEIMNAVGPASIACVSGFLTNMVDRKVKLISPCAASDRWPLGYKIFSEGTFETPADLIFLIEKMISEHMPESLAEEAPVGFRPDLRYQTLENGFQVSTIYQQVNFVNPELTSYLKDLGDAVLRGSNTAGQLSLVMLYQHGMPPETTLGILESMFNRGMLNEGPQ